MEDNKQPKHETFSFKTTKADKPKTTSLPVPEKEEETHEERGEQT